MHKFFTPIELFTEDYATIIGDDVKHIYKVLRLDEGEKVIVNNEQGEEFLGNIEEINKKEVRIKLLEKLDANNESSINIYLFQGVPKAAKMDLIVQKATELGVKEIIPTITSRVDVRIDGEYKKLDRLQRIALEACKQSKRTIIPKVKDLIELNKAGEVLNSMDLIVVPYENAQGFGVKKMIKDIDGNSVKNIAIVIGPEGGFEEAEIEYLKSLNAHIVTLGPRILRTETAGFVCASLLQYELADLGGNV